MEVETYYDELQIHLHREGSHNTSFELGGQILTVFIMGRCVKKYQRTMRPICVPVSVRTRETLQRDACQAPVGTSTDNNAKKTKTERPQHSANEHRIVVYNHSPRPEHTCICHFKVESVQQCKLTFFQSSSNVIILYEKTPACSLEKLITFHNETLFKRTGQPPTENAVANTTRRRDRFQRTR